MYRYNARCVLGNVRVIIYLFISCKMQSGVHTWSHALYVRLHGYYSRNYVNYYHPIKRLLSARWVTSLVDFTLNVQQRGGNGPPLSPPTSSKRTLSIKLFSFALSPRHGKSKTFDKPFCRSRFRWHQQWQRIHRARKTHTTRSKYTHLIPSTLAPHFYIRDALHVSSRSVMFYKLNHYGENGVFM